MNWDKLRKQYREALTDVVSLDAWEKTFGISSEQPAQAEQVHAER